MIDFSLPDDVTEVRRRVAAFIDAEVQPYVEEVGTRPYLDIVADLQVKARAEGLWCPFIPAEWGGMGLGHLANAAVQVEVARTRYHLAAWAMNCMGPQDATMLTLLELGTDEQKEKYLRPAIDGTLRLCFAMTERAAGSDATGMRTAAVPDGDDWVLNGEKWFTSGAALSDVALVMARTDPDAPRHRQYSTFLVELPNPGFQIVRNIPVLSEAVEPRFEDEIPLAMGHAEVRIENLRVPHENILGTVGGGFDAGQFRLGYGRLRHGMWSIARAQAALDLATQYALDRETFGAPVASRQGIQFKLARCAQDLYIARLMVLHIAYKMENGLGIEHENSIAKNFIADMESNVIDTALQIHGSLGYTMDTPLAAWYAEVKQQHLVDGPDEVHAWKTGRAVIQAQQESGTTAAVAGGTLI
jgi:acyl-CoA dehydrogenase